MIKLALLAAFAFAMFMSSNALPRSRWSRLTVKTCIAQLSAYGEAKPPSPPGVDSSRLLQREDRDRDYDRCQDRCEALIAATTNAATRLRPRADRQLLDSVNTCPHCAVAKAETMPAGACHFSMCAAAAVQNCGPSRAIVRVLCLRFPCHVPDSKSSVGRAGAASCLCRVARRGQTTRSKSRRTGSASRRANALAWWVPQGTMVAALFIPSPFEPDLDCRTD